MNQKRKKKTNLKLLISLIIFITTIIGFIYFPKIVDKTEFINVPGIIINKGSTEHVKKHSSEPLFLFAIKPDNQNYKIYDVNVSFATWSSYNIGDHISFKIEKSVVGIKNNYKTINSIIFLVLLFILFIAIGSFILILTDIIDN